MEALGRLINPLVTADDVYVSVKNCGGITFLCLNAAGETWTLTEAKDAAGTGAQVLTTITRYHTSATVGAVWLKHTQAAASTVVSTASEDVVVIEVEAAELSDTYDYIKLASTGSGTVVAIQRDLSVQRAPANLPALV